MFIFGAGIEFVIIGFVRERLHDFFRMRSAAQVSAANPTIRQRFGQSLVSYKLRIDELHRSNEEILRRIADLSDEESAAG